LALRETALDRFKLGDDPLTAGQQPLALAFKILAFERDGAPQTH
jgi:hypothetical protein